MSTLRTLSIALMLGVLASSAQAGQFALTPAPIVAAPGAAAEQPMALVFVGDRNTVGAAVSYAFNAGGKLKAEVFSGKRAHCVVADGVLHATLVDPDVRPLAEAETTYCLIRFHVSADARPGESFDLVPVENATLCVNHRGDDLACDAKAAIGAVIVGSHLSRARPTRR